MTYRSSSEDHGRVRLISLVPLKSGAIRERKQGRRVAARACMQRGGGGGPRDDGASPYTGKDLQSLRVCVIRTICAGSSLCVI